TFAGIPQCEAKLKETHRTDGQYSCAGARCNTTSSEAEGGNVGSRTRGRRTGCTWEAQTSCYVLGWIMPLRAREL
uniref:Uncharacterized protein n=1 Tax=Aegilops tauschii subsp. strangulata TaxID=200361 RepID=A0A453CCZ5_AEGTS